MKKSILFYFVVVLLITVLCVPSSAADFDFSGYSVDELMEAYKAINQEIVDRALEKTAHLKGGVYVGGIDIPISIGIDFDLVIKPRGMIQFE